MQPITATPSRPSKVFILPMRADQAMQMFPGVSGLPESDVYVVVTEAGQPVLITDTRAEALRQLRRQARFVLGKLH